MLKLFAVVVCAVVVGTSCSENRPCRDDEQCDGDDVCIFINPDDDLGACGTRAQGEGEGEGEPAEGEGEPAEGEGEPAEGEGEGEVRRAVDVKVGAAFTCAIDNGGGVQCWGGNSRGQLGRDTNGATSNVPTRIAGLANVTALATGDVHACAKGQLGGNQAEVHCWGETADLGVDPVVPEGVLAQPALGAGVGRDVVAIASSGDNNGSLTCVAHDDGGVSCFGQRGSRRPSRLEAFDDFVVRADGLTVALGSVCAASTTGTVLCVSVGFGGSLGGLDDFGCIDGIPCSALVGTFSSTSDTACRVQGIRLRCAGENDDGVAEPAARPNDVIDDVVIATNATDVALSEHHGCAIVEGRLKCWGRTLNFATGLAVLDVRAEPCDRNPDVTCHGLVEPSPTVLFTAVSVHRQRSCGLGNDGVVTCFGLGGGGQAAGPAQFRLR